MSLMQLLGIGLMFGFALLGVGIACIAAMFARQWEPSQSNEDRDRFFKEYDALEAMRKQRKRGDEK